MGAYMCGYFLFVPKKTAGKVMKEHLKKLKAINESSSVKFIKSLAGETQEDATENMLNAYAKAGVSVDDISAQGLDDEEATLESIQSKIEEIEESLKQGIDWGSRDTATAEMKVNGCQVSVHFAGGMTWGDEPDGAGYKLLQDLCYLGFENALYNSIPWGNKKPKRRK